MSALSPKTGAPCFCTRGVQRDNCTACEGSGWVIDFAAIRRTTTQTHPAQPEGALTMNTLSAFIADQHVTMTATRVDRNPHISDMNPDARHWRCTLKTPAARMTLHFSQGSAHTEPPTAADVLDCLASDASSFENARDFADWCGEYGYDIDSRKAERIYKTIGRQAASLKRMLGDAYDDLLWNTERQ